MVLLFIGLYLMCVGTLAWFLGRNEASWSKKEIVMYVGLPIPITCFLFGIPISILGYYTLGDGDLEDYLLAIGLLILFVSFICCILGCAVAYVAVKFSRK
jgi:uncharacterized membrane protein